MTDPAMPKTSVALPVVPDLCAAFGYPGDARYVVFYLDADLDDVIDNDGVQSGNGATWVWQAYRRHRAVEPLLRPFDLTSPDSNLVLVIDQQGSRASVATGSEAADFLRQHRPPVPQLTDEQMARVEELVLQGWREEHVDQAEVLRQMQEQRARVGRVMSWLDMAPVPEDGKGHD
jgi:hypothetical protein